MEYCLGSASDLLEGKDNITVLLLFVLHHVLCGAKEAAQW